ncbi:MAG: DUF1887 family CARF protein [Oscillospiraceae bacterium]
METLVELFDNEPIKNILACRIFKPQTVLFICDDKVSQQKKDVTSRMLENWELGNVKTVFYTVDTSEYSRIYEKIETLLNSYPNCVFDITGGRDPVLFASGVLCSKNNIPSFFIDLHNLTFHNVFGCENLKNDFVLPRFRVKDILASAGAKIEGYGKYRPDKRDTQTADDILKIWDILWKSPSAWAAQVAWFQQALKSDGHKSSEQLVYESFLELKANGVETIANTQILEALYAMGALTHLTFNKNHVNLTFKNVPLKNCLMSHGIWLELYGFLKAYNVNWFNDVKTSVMIGWADRVLQPYDTRNEIDIILVKGITPVFISCKMGIPNALALSEIKTLAMRFGGVMAKTVLFSASDVKNGNPTIYNRACELGIYIVDKADIDADNVAKRFMQIANAYYI